MNNPALRLASIVRLGLFLAISCCLAGCGPSNPLTQKISAHSGVDHNLWRSSVRGSLSSEQWADFDEAIQEVRLKIMAERIATLSADVDAALWKKIHLSRICDVVVEGYEFRLKRLEADRVELERIHKLNSSLRTKPGDTASANRLTEISRDEADRIAALETKIARTKERLQTYDAAASTRENQGSGR